ncbi:MAG TPA: CDP-alcohol phosphatidyltransferase family protein [Blastocatellia bacterium]|nr:CDP-alcohol phosphatidyltransferase family protein [Blastocatellia bacterium]
MSTPPSGHEREQPSGAMPDETARVWTIANVLTGVRLLIIPPFLYYVVRGDFTVALLLFVIGAVTDSADGYLARKLHQQSVLGRLMDPVADKLLTASAYVAMAIPRETVPTIPIWLAVSVVSRDVLILLGAAVIYAVTGFKQFRPTLLGKVNTFLELGMIVVFLLVQSLGLMSQVLPPLYVVVGSSIAASTVSYVVVAARTLWRVKRA